MTQGFFLKKTCFKLVLTCVADAICCTRLLTRTGHKGTRERCEFPSLRTKNVEENLNLLSFGSNRAVCPAQKSDSVSEVYSCIYSTTAMCGNSKNDICTLQGPNIFELEVIGDKYAHVRSSV